MTRPKVVGIDGGKKEPESCQFCGADPACPNLTCPRLKFVEVDGADIVAVEFFTEAEWKKPDA